MLRTSISKSAAMQRGRAVMWQLWFSCHTAQWRRGSKLKWFLFPAESSMCPSLEYVVHFDKALITALLMLNFSPMAKGPFTVCSNPRIARSAKYAREIPSLSHIITEMLSWVRLWCHLPISINALPFLSAAASFALNSAHSSFPLCNVHQRRRPITVCLCVVLEIIANCRYPPPSII